MSFRTLDNWVRIGLVTCSQVAGGTGTRRAWTVDDVTRAAYIRALRKNGISTQQLNAMKKTGRLDTLLDRLLKQEKAHTDKKLFSVVILIVGGKKLPLTTIREKRKAVEKAFDALEAGLPPEPLTYDHAPPEIEVWVE
jgi:DNA-binding transcriptional MerR regulator